MILSKNGNDNETAILASVPNVSIDPTGATQAQGGKSDQAEISGDGTTIAYRSLLLILSLSKEYLMSRLSTEGQVTTVILW